MEAIDRASLVRVGSANLSGPLRTKNRRRHKATNAADLYWGKGPLSPSTIVKNRQRQFSAIKPNRSMRLQLRSLLKIQYRIGLTLRKVNDEPATFDNLTLKQLTKYGNRNVNHQHRHKGLVDRDWSSQFSLVVNLNTFTLHCENQKEHAKISCSRVHWFSRGNS